MENGLNAFTGIVNTILWNTGDELKGDSFSVTCSCVEGGYPGEGNISSNPMFLDTLNPKGNDGYYGNSNDGLNLDKKSPCIDKAVTDSSPEYDILLTQKPYGVKSDIGAYEYENYAGQENVFGFLEDGVFVPEEILHTVKEFSHWKYIRIYSKSNYSRVMKIKVKRNKYTEDNDFMHLDIQGTNINGNPLKGSDEVKINLKQVDKDNQNVYFQSKTTDWGKFILFTKDTVYQAWSNPWAYLILVDENSSVKIRVPHDQF